MPLPHIDRRRFLQLAGVSAASVAMTEQLNGTIARAQALPAHRRHGNLRDIDHIVVLMQENRSFDHLYGSLRGVRGFSDPHPATLPSGKSVRPMLPRKRTSPPKTKVGRQPSIR